MPQGILLAGGDALVAAAAHVVGRRQRRAAIQQNLQDLVVVHVGGQDQRRYVRGEVGRRPVNSLPAL